VAWIGGALLVGKILVNPLLAAKSPWLTVEKGLLRRLPVELTMADDLPAFLIQPPRIRIPHGDPGDRLWLYFLDQNAWPPEPEGIWVSGSGRAEIIVRRSRPIDHLLIEAHSPIATTLTIDMGGASVRFAVIPGRTSVAEIPARGAIGPRGDLGSYFYLLTVRSSAGFIPHLREPTSTDYRNLGAQLRLSTGGVDGVSSSDH